MAKSDNKIMLVSTESDHFYTIEKSNKKSGEKLNLKKYDPKIRKHVLYKEKKISK